MHQVRHVFTRGTQAVENGQIKAQPGHGKFVAREPKKPVNRALSTYKSIVAPRKVERSGIPVSGV